MGRPANTDAAVTREKILEAALDLFAERGFFGTSMREIAGASGVTGGALYHHFESKDAILHMLMAEKIDPAQQEMALPLDMDHLPPLRDLLSRLVNHALDVFARPVQRKAFRILMNDGFRLVQEGVITPMDLGQKPRLLVIALLRALQERAVVRAEVDPEYAAMLLMGPLLAYRQLKMVWGVPGLDGLDRDVFVRHHVDALARVLSPARTN